MAADVAIEPVSDLDEHRRTLAYILVLMLVMQVVSGFILYFIVPKFEAIFSDFNMRAARVTIWSSTLRHFSCSIRGPHVVLFPCSSWPC